jgi:D-3-phosphoglycerate dehydrogenase
MSHAELLDAIAPVHVLGVRSKTRVGAEILAAAPRLLAVGCFCIGTDQVDLDAARQRGVPVFNAPFSNTRSVAELAMANIVMLSRQAVQRSMELHQGLWRKTARGCYEVRNKRLGIVGYGHIGPQIGLLAEAFGMEVCFYDIVPKLPLGTAVQVDTLERLLRESDFVTLHVPETPRTQNMIGGRELALMRKGSFLLNLSRGSVVDVPALAAALRSGHLAGAACDVYPHEPASSDEVFRSDLRGLPNVILTPHIGGSTQEAQQNIGIEVATALVRFIETGSSTGAVNFPQVQLPVVQNSHRVLHVHRNVPGVLMAVNGVMGGLGVNIEAQHLGTLADTGYLIMDVDRRLSREVKRRIDELESTIRTRLVF